MIKKILKDELIKGSLLLIILLGVFNILNYIFQMSMAKMLSVEDYGVLATLMSIVYIFGIPSEAIQTLASRYASKFNSTGIIKDFLIKSLKRMGKYLFFFFFAFLVVSIWLSSFLGIKFALFFITGLTLFGSFLVPINRGILQGRKKFMAMGMNMVFESAFKIMISILLVFLSFKVYGAMMGVVFGILFAFAISFLSMKEILKSKRKKENLEFSFGARGIIAICAIVLMYSLDIILARRFFTAEVAGQYAFISLIGKAIIFANLAIGKAMFPISSEKFNKGKTTKGLLKKSMTLVCIISAIALIFYFFMPQLIVKILSLWDTKYLPAANILFLVGLGFAFVSLSNVIILYKLSINKTKYFYWLLIFPVLQVIFLSLFHSSLREFSLGLVISNVLMLIYSLAIIRR
ncbi:MAG: oligosaccharide flippase family protein [Candidatus Pacearchaeota archaeon]|nr:oligosaccharide flippase family protein [Candidatus Pacearchaeota archaeon]